MSAAPDWIAGDWGSTHLRLWPMAADGHALGPARRSDQGMTRITERAGFEPVFLDLAGDWLAGRQGTPVVLCGMVGARQGWAEAPYATAPCAPPSLAKARAVAGCDPRLSLHILPGIRQLTPPDVMRGEETQIAGILSAEPNFDGVICLPGTHCKWVHVSAGEVVSFRSFMTGELFDLLTRQSVLRHSVAHTGPLEPEAFAEALTDAMSRPAEVAASLFQIRAAHLLHDTPPEQARATLSGLLIGMELAAARPYWLGREVIVLGQNSLGQAYLTALERQGVMVRAFEAERAVLAGLAAAYRTITEAPC